MASSAPPGTKIMRSLIGCAVKATRSRLSLAWTIDEGKSYPLLRGLNNAPEALNPTAGLLPHSPNRPEIDLQQIGQNAVIHLSSPALVRMLDITGHQIAPEVRLAAGVHILTPTTGARIRRYVPGEMRQGLL